MSYIKDNYTVSYNGRIIGYCYVYTNRTVSYSTAWGCPWDIEKELKELGLDREIKETKSIRLFSELINDEKRVPGRKRIVYEDGPLRMERKSSETGERYSVYRRRAEKGEPDYSPLPHDAPHYEGPKTPEGMREWASWYAFNKMDDGTFEAELDEAWWWGGGTMTAARYTERSRRSGSVCPTMSSWRGW